MRLLFHEKSGALRPFLKVVLTSDGSVVLSPIGRVPYLLRSWKTPLAAERLGVKALHATIHGSGDVHLKVDGSKPKEYIESHQVPPLRNFSAASYFLQIMPAPLSEYAVDNLPRPEDAAIDISKVEKHGFSLMIAVAVLDSPTDTLREAYPGVDPCGPIRLMRLFLAREGLLEVQVALVWFEEDPPVPLAHETWSLIRLPEGGDFLPRPVGGSLTRLVWTGIMEPGPE